MRVGEALSKMELLGYTGLETGPKAEERARSYRAAGIVDGDDLQTAFDRWEQSVKKNNRAPRADEFMKFMPEKLLEAPRQYRFDWDKYREAYADVFDWAWKQIIGKYGNPDAAGPVYDGRQLSAWLADENAWLNRFDPSDKCSRYVKLKLRYDEGWGGIEAVEAAKAAIVPTPEQVEQVRVAA